MKKTAILALAVAMPAMAGTPAPVVTVPVPAPAPVAAPAPAGCALELAGVYRFASRDLADDAKATDTYGFDLTAVHSFTPNHAFTLRAGYAYGSEVTREDGASLRAQLDTLCLMPGYRYTHGINDQWSWFAGANVGVVWGKCTARLSDAGDVAKLTDHEYGLGASVELGLKYQICDHSYVFAAYELSGNNIKYADKETHQQVYHGIRAGVGIQF